MNPEIKERWIKALESGEYKHTKMLLRYNDCHCVIGVLCDLHSKETNTPWGRKESTFKYLGAACYAPPEIVLWSGMSGQEAANCMSISDTSRDYTEAIKYIKEQL